MKITFLYRSGNEEDLGIERDLLGLNTGRFYLVGLFEDFEVGIL